MRSNFFVTTSGMLNPALLQHALSVTSVDRLIFSTDYPFQQPTRDDISSFLEHFSSDEERDMFSSSNAASLYGLDLDDEVGVSTSPAVAHPAPSASS
jgi:predicted TIM-barrel fold metal-dependent hydrolase